MKHTLNDRWNRIAVRALAELPAGWRSQEQLAWDVWKRAEVIRGRTRAMLAVLAQHGLIERLDVAHQDQMLPCYLIDPTALAAIVARAESTTVEVITQEQTYD